MNIETAIIERRSVKQFDPHFRIPDADVNKMLSLAMLSPTAFNIQHWRFVVIQDTALRESIRSVSWQQTQITDASVLIAICADTRAWEKEPLRYWRKAPDEAREGIANLITDYYIGNEQAQRDEALRSCGLAAQTLMLAAKGMGYDSCPMGLTDFDEIGRLIHLPEDHLMAMFVAIGKGLAEPWPRKEQLELDEVVIQDRF